MDGGTYVNVLLQLRIALQSSADCRLLRRK
jgi:hypothetical protein